MSSRILVTLLGKVFTNYRCANYRFNQRTRTSRFFGLSLCEEIKPDKLIVLGTTGSMWDNLLRETPLATEEGFEEELQRLGEAAQNDKVKQSTLNTLAQRLQKVLAIECALKLIPYGRRQAEQIDTLEILVSSFNEKDTAILDVTNGLRHLPMLVQQSALLLQTLKKVHIENIYYGALDLTTRVADSELLITPVMKLTGLLEIDRWSQALQHYDKDGDYSVFVDLFAQAGMRRAGIKALQEAAFYEQMNNIGLAQLRLQTFLKILQQEETTYKPHSKLFLPALKQRFSWINHKEYHLRQTEVAWMCLENSNLTRACLQGFEAFISRLVQDNQGDPAKYDDREKVKWLCKTLHHTEEVCEKYHKLRNLRNQIVHGYAEGGNKTQKQQQKAEAIKRIISNPDTFYYTLSDIFTAIIPKQCD